MVRRNVHGYIADVGMEGRVGGQLAVYSLVLFHLTSIGLGVFSKSYHALLSSELANKYVQDRRGLLLHTTCQGDSIGWLLRY